MKKRITSISAGQLAKVGGSLYTCMTLPFVPFGIGILLFGGKDRAMGVALILAPLIYGIGGYAFAFIATMILNLIMQRVGGIEFTVEDVHEPS